MATRKRRRKVKWTIVDREMLEKLLAEGYRVPRIAKSLDKPASSIYNEIRRCLEPEEYAEQRYIKYTAKKAIDKEIARLKGELDDDE